MSIKRHIFVNNSMMFIYNEGLLYG